MCDELIQLLTDLVRVDTTNPPGNEGEAALVLSDWIAKRDRGIHVEVDELGRGRANLVARIDGHEPGPVLMLNSHLDVVPAADDWRLPPFAGVVEDGFVYGRGAADAKASLAVMAATLVRLAGRRHTWRGTLVLTAVADEEVGSAGTRRLLARLRPDGAIVGEPTGLRLMTAHKGSFRPVISVGGRAAHAAQPEGGVNAVTGAGHLLVELGELSSSLNSRHHPLLGAPTLVPTLVSGGEAPNSVPAACKITLDRRLLPGETDASVLAEIESFLAGFRSRHPEFQVTVVRCLPTTGGPSETPIDQPFVLACRDGLSVVGQSAEPAGLLVNCDMTHFRAHGVPTVVYGPGRPEVMHTRDERVAVADLEAALVGLEAMVDKLLGRSDGWGAAP